MLVSSSSPCPPPASEDGLADLGWYSAPLYTDLELSAPQRCKKEHTIELSFAPGVVSSVSRIGVQFQGGFVGLGGNARVKTTRDGECDYVVERWGEFDDANVMQYCEVANGGGGGGGAEGGGGGGGVSTLTLTFDRGSDFYGRVIIYQLEIWGTLTPS